jgi:hypothetical protein
MLQCSVGRTLSSDPSVFSHGRKNDQPDISAHWMNCTGHCCPCTPTPWPTHTFVHFSASMVPATAAGHDREDPRGRKPCWARWWQLPSSRPGEMRSIPKTEARTWSMSMDRDFKSSQSVNCSKDTGYNTGYGQCRGRPYWLESQMVF